MSESDLDRLAITYRRAVTSDDFETQIRIWDTADDATAERLHRVHAEIVRDQERRERN